MNPKRLMVKALGEAVSEALEECCQSLQIRVILGPSSEQGRSREQAQAKPKNT